MFDTASRWSVLLLVAGAALALSIVVVGLAGRSVYLLNQLTAQSSGACTAPLVSAACNMEPANSCKAGYLYQSDSSAHSFCRTENKVTGTACTSPCFRPGSTGTHACTAAGVCNSTNVLDCYGSCTNSNDAVYTWPASDCATSLNFTDYFKWNTATSSANPYEWMFYSDFMPECWLGRCYWNAFLLEFEIAKNPSAQAGIFTNTHAVIDPMIMLNQSNKDACIAFKDFPFDTNFSSNLYSKMFADTGYSSSAALYNAKMTLRLFYYNCAPFNTSMMTYPENLFENAAATATTPEGFAKRNLVTSRLDDIKQRIADHVTVQSGNPTKLPVLTHPRVSTLPSRRERG